MPTNKTEWANVISGKLASLEGADKLIFLTDNKTGAAYCECHIKGSKLVELGTVDVPLDPDEQAEYRANRELVENAYAFTIMKEDAKARRAFSNIVAEYTTEFDEEHPVKIIGGQHRFAAIAEALAHGVDEYHGVKLYIELNKEQRLDVQLISNTNIEISGDLYDRMHETVRGPQLRSWAQSVGLLQPGEDFADKRQRGGPISVQVARTFIINYYLGTQVPDKKFDATETTPVLPTVGQTDAKWEELQKKLPDLWNDKELKTAAQEFAKLVAAQRAAYSTSAKAPADFREKAMNLAVISAWSFVAGVLKKNKVRLNKHFELSASPGGDPLNANALAKARHKSDPENYRGLGYRTDAKERGRLAELFFLQAEDGGGISKKNIEVAMAKYHAKQAILEVEKAKAKA